MTFSLRSCIANGLFALFFVASLPALAHTQSDSISKSDICNSGLGGIPQNSSVILAANRLPLTLKIENGQIVRGEAHGGLVAALRSTGEKFSWLGWPGHEIADEDKGMAAFYLKGADSHFDLQPVFMSQAEKVEFYDEYSNRVIWPMFHGLLRLLPQERIGWETYKEVNLRFADQLFSAIQTEAAATDRQILVWVHDYQLLLVPKLLREMVHLAGLNERVRIGFFLHIPFPSPHELHQIPLEQRRVLVEGMAAADHLGFQTPNDLRAYTLATTELGLSSDKASVDPVGIDPRKLEAVYASAETQDLISKLQEKYDGYELLVGVERLDPIKGIVEKLRGYREFLERNPDKRGKVVLVQVAQASRMDIPEYRALRDRVHRLTDGINKRYAVPGRLPPVILDEKGFSQVEVLAHFGVARAILINSLRDGMNLVSFETEVVQKFRAHPASLILSQQAGAASWLPGALTVNPVVPKDIANAIARSLTMSTDEAIERNTRNNSHIDKMTSGAWLSRSLNGLVRPASTAKP